VKLHLGDVVGYQAIDYRVEGVLDFTLADRTLRLVAMVAGNEVLFLEPIVMADRVLLMSQIALLDISSPPPATIYHQGESYLLKLSGETTVDVTGQVDGRKPSSCRLWRYRAAGDRYLQIEQWPDALRMLAGTAIHKGMLEVRPATDEPPPVLP